MPLIRRHLFAGLAFALLTVLSARPALAVDYYADISGGPWDDNTTWHIGTGTGPVPPAGTYPGTVAGDRAFVDIQGPTVTVTTVIPNPVTVDWNNVSCSLDVSPGGSLSLTGASFIRGGCALNLTGGTIDNDGTLTIGINSGFNWSGGTLTGSGSTTLAF